MIIYEAFTLYGSYYEPLHVVGIYNNLAIAKQVAENNSGYAETLHVDVMELEGNKFEVKERWTFDKRVNNTKWKKEAF